MMGNKTNKPSPESAGVVMAAKDAVLKTVTNTCPAKIFANNRIAKLKTFMQCETSSIGQIAGTIKRGSPDGMKN